MQRCREVWTVIWRRFPSWPTVFGSFLQHPCIVLSFRKSHKSPSHLKPPPFSQSYSLRNAKNGTSPFGSKIYPTLSYVRQPFTVVLCGKGFYNVLARKTAHRNTSTTPRPPHQTRKKKVIVYVSLLFNVFCAGLTRRQNPKSTSIRKIHLRTFLEKSYRESLKINLHNSRFISYLDFNTFLTEKRQCTKLQDNLQI